MFGVRFDLSQFESRARDMNAALTEVPFALSLALNDAAKATRSHLVDTVWPSHVTVRNKRFLGVAMRTDWATKGNLIVSIYDTLGRAHLKLHAVGGSKQARGKFAVPLPGAVTRTGSGVRKSQQPRNLSRAVRKGDVIFQEQGRGRNKKLKPMYKLAPVTRQPKDVPFYEEFGARFRAEMQARFPAAMRKAMRTRRR